MVRLLSPGRDIRLRAENVGDATVSGAGSPVTISDVLPAGLKAVGINRYRRVVILMS